MNFLNLNCQHGEQPELKDFLYHTLNAGKYDFLLLEEVNEKVLAFLRHPSYKLVRSFNEETGRDSDLCIAYRAEYHIANTKFKSFASMRKDPMFGFKHPSPGLLWADFNINNKVWRIAVTHLHSGTNSNVRIQELQTAKKLLLSKTSMPIILAGDCNAGLPRERMQLAQIMAPEFSWVTKNLGSTLDSRYTENAAHLPNRIAAFLSIFNIGILLRTDHVFVDRETANRSTIKCRVLPDRVSDHSPVEFICG